MTRTSVALFARELKMPPTALLAQLAKAGVPKQSANDVLTEQDKTRLLDYMRKTYGDPVPRAKIILRKKRVFVKRDTFDLADGSIASTSAQKPEGQMLDSQQTTSLEADGERQSELAVVPATDLTEMQARESIVGVNARSAYVIHAKGKSTATERRMLAYLQSHLPEGWFVLGNVNVGSGRDNRELDAIVIGPDFVWAIDEKSWQQVARGDRSHWWLPPKHGKPEKKERSPIDKQLETARIVKSFIKETCPRVWVEPLVLLTGNPDLSAVDDSRLSSFTKRLEGSERYFLAPGISQRASRLRTEEQLALISRLIGESTAREAFDALGIGQEKPEVTQLGCPVCDTLVDVFKVACPKCEWQFGRLLNIPSAEEIHRQQVAVLAHRKQWEEKLAAERDPLYQLRMAAERGDATAQCNLAGAYYSGKGIPQDHAEAVKWYRKAADQGHAPAQNSLGVAYYRGEGVSKDDAESVKWFLKAANQGEAAAQDNLGEAYDEGDGVPQDHAEALKWYRKAADQGFYANVLFADEVCQDRAQAVKWHRMAVEQGDAVAQSSLGDAYHSGKGVAQDHVEAIKWYRQAATQGYDAAQWKLGKAYEEGDGVIQDHVEAVNWYRKAADQGHSLALSDLLTLHKQIQLAEEERRTAALEAERNRKAEQKHQERAKKQASEETLWRGAVMAGTIDGFRNYIIKTELRTHELEAVQRIAAMEAVQRDAESKCQDEQRRKKQEEQNTSEQARKRAQETEEVVQEEQLWQQAMNGNSKFSYSSYLTKSKRLDHEQEAKRRIVDLDEREKKRIADWDERAKQEERAKQDAGLSVAEIKAQWQVLQRELALEEERRIVTRVKKFFQASEPAKPNFQEMRKGGNVIRVERVFKEYLEEYQDKRRIVSAISNVTLQIAQGVFLAICGSSGSGKTTLLKLMGCLECPTQGEVLIDDQNVSELKGRNLVEFRLRNVGFVSEEPDLMPKLSAAENVEYSLSQRSDISRHERSKRVKFFLDVVGLRRQIDIRPASLSRSQRKRVALAQALAGSPRLLLLDEPTASLDDRESEMFVGLLERIYQAFHVTIICAARSANMERRSLPVMRIANQFVAIDDGCIQELGVRRGGEWAVARVADYFDASK